MSAALFSWADERALRTFIWSSLDEVSRLAVVELDRFDEHKEVIELVTDLVGKRSAAPASALGGATVHLVDLARTRPDQPLAELDGRLHAQAPRGSAVVLWGLTEGRAAPAGVLHALDLQRRPFTGRPAMPWLLLLSSSAARPLADLAPRPWALSSLWVQGRRAGLLLPSLPLPAGAPELFPPCLGAEPPPDVEAAAALARAGQVNAAWKRLRELAEDPRASDPAWLASVTRERAWVEGHEASWERTVELLYEARAQASRAGAGLLELDILDDLSRAFDYLGRVEVAAALLEDQRVLAATVGGGPARLGRALLGRSTMLARVGRWQEARDRCRDAAALHARHGHVGAEGVCHLLLARLHWTRGELEAGRAALDEGRRQAETAGPQHGALASAEAFFLERLHGDASRAESLRHAANAALARHAPRLLRIYADSLTPTEPPSPDSAPDA